MSSQAENLAGTKKCSKCLKELAFENFHKKERRKDGSYRYESACKKCRAKKYKLKKVSRVFSAEVKLTEFHDLDFIKEDLESFLGDIALSVVFGIDDEK